MSLAQERLLLLDEFEGAAAYNIPFVLRAAASPEVIIRALRTLLKAGGDGVRRQHPVPVPEALSMFDIPLYFELAPDRDDFFRSGGDSTNALHLASQVQREIERKVTVKYVFDFPTVRLFAKPLTDRNCWNQTFAILTPPLDPARLRHAVDRLVEHHDTFRLRYSPPTGAAGEITQIYGEDHPGIVVHELDVWQLRDEHVTRQLTAWQRDFDLEHGATSCAAYLHGFEDGTSRVWFAVHHLIVDSVSWYALTQDLEILYHGGNLGQKTISYRQWVRAVQGSLPGEAERRFWAEVKQGMASSSPSILSVAPTNATTRREEFKLSAMETQTLLAESLWAYDTEINDTKANRWRVPHHGIEYTALFGRYDGSAGPLPSVSFTYLGRLTGDEAKSAPSQPGAWQFNALVQNLQIETPSGWQDLPTSEEDFFQFGNNSAVGPFIPYGVPVPEQGLNPVVHTASTSGGGLRALIDKNGQT